MECVFRIREDSILVVNTDDLDLKLGYLEVQKIRSRLVVIKNYNIFFFLLQRNFYDKKMFLLVLQINKNKFVPVEL